MPVAEDEPILDPEVTTLLRRWGAGDRSAAEAVLPHVYDELRRIASSHFRAGGHTLQPTILVHDAFLRLVERSEIPWQNRAHFYGVAARAMRQVLVDYLRHRNRAKRGGNAVRVTIVDNLIGDAASDIDLLALHDALERLERMDPEKARIVELRFFGGLSIAETAEFLGISPASVVRRWRRARAWLFDALNSSA